METELPAHKRCRLIFFMIIMGVCAMPIGYATASSNQVTDTLNEKYGWTTEEEKALHQSFIGTSVVVGMATGAFTGGKIIPYGRRLAMIIANSVGILGVSLTMI